MVAHEREADHADGREDAWAEHGEALLGVALELRGHMLTLDEHGDDYGDHAYQREEGRACELVNRPVEGEWVRDADGAERDDELALGEEGEDGYRVEGGEYRAYDVRYCVALEIVRGGLSGVRSYSPMMIPNAHMPVRW